MTIIVNAIDQCLDHKRQAFDVGAIEGFMVHRCGIDLNTGVVLGHSGPEVSDAFTGNDLKWAEVARVTGYQNAYGILIGGDLGPAEYDGRIWQILPLDEVGWHARRFSKMYLGIGLIADPRRKAPSAAQASALKALLAMLCPAFGKDPLVAIKGHGEVPGSHDGTKAPGGSAACPGDLLDMGALRVAVALEIESQARRRLSETGLVLSA
jgi:hypothetical protein